VKLYSAVRTQRFWQVFGDLMLLGWIALCTALGLAVFRITNALGYPGRKAASAGDGLAEDLRKLSEPVGRIPVVGDELRAPVDGAAGAAVEQLAYLLAGVTITLPVLFALLIWLPRRIRFSRRATAAQKFIDNAADLDLFALRAMANQPMHKLAKISNDPVTAWRDGDSAVIAQLADLELRATGLRAPKQLTPPPPTDPELTE
jgi:hypothetical protein